MERSRHPALRHVTTAAARPHLLGIVRSSRRSTRSPSPKRPRRVHRQQDAAPPLQRAFDKVAGHLPTNSHRQDPGCGIANVIEQRRIFPEAATEGHVPPGRVIQPLGSTRTRRAVNRSAVLAWPHRRTREPEHQGWWTSLARFQESGSSDDPERLLRLRCSARGSRPFRGADELERTLRQELDIVLLPFAGQQSSGGRGRRGCAPGSGRRIGDRSSGRRPRRQTRRERMSTTIRLAP